MPRSLSNFDAVSPRRLKSQALAPSLDVAYYRARYPDLAKKSPIALRFHWARHGRAEGRFASAAEELSILGDGVDRQTTEFDGRTYLSLNPDLIASGVRLETAEVHYVGFGKAEGRPCKFNHGFYESITAFRGLAMDGRDPVTHWREVGRHLGIPTTAEDTVNEAGLRVGPLKRISATQVRDANPALSHLEDDAAVYLALTQRPGFSVAPSSDHQFCGEVFVALAFHRLHSGEAEWARWLMELASLYGDCVAQEWLGNQHLEAGRADLARVFYESALQEGTQSHWVHFNLSQVLATVRTEAGCWSAVERAADGVETYPDWTHLLERQYDALKDWLTFAVEESEALVQAGRSSEATSVLSVRLEKLVNRAPIWAERQIIPRDRRLRTKITIIADLGLPQCVRYRVQQRVSQFQELGWRVELRDWKELRRSADSALGGLLWFYRAPLTPETAFHAASAKARGVPTIYETDDLIFDNCYPGSIEGFGGAVGPREFAGLISGSLRYRALASLCEFSVGSTPLVASELAALNDSSPMVIPNCLDQHHLKAPSSPVWQTSLAKRVVCLATGSRAHIADFYSLVRSLPDVLAEISDVQFLFLAPMEYRAILPRSSDFDMVHITDYLPPQQYQSVLAGCSIVLAPMRLTRFNDGKSEIRWLDATAAGVPVIASPIAPYRHLSDQGALLLAETPDEWSRRIVSLLSEPELGRSLVKRAKLVAEESYSGPAGMEALQKVLECIGQPR